MTQQTINVGTVPNDQTGDQARTAFQKVNANFTEVYAGTIPGLSASTGSSLVGHIASGTGAVATTVQTKLRESVSVKDFGAVGDGVTDDTTAVANAAAAANNVNAPQGFYKTTYNFATIPQNYYAGAGQIKTLDSSVVHPRGNKVFRLYSQPSPLSNGGSVISFYDNNFISKENYDITVTGATTVGNPATGYAQYDQLTPQFFGAYFSSGNNTSATTADGRTGWSISRYRLTQAGKGDAGCINANAIITANNPTHTGLYGTPAANLFGGNISASVGQVYLNPYEVNCEDNGNDVRCVGHVTNFNRTNGTAANGEYWAGVRLQASGTVTPDAAFQVANNWKVGLDTTIAGTTVRAIALKEDQEIHFDAAALTFAGAQTYAGTFGGTKISYNSATSNFTFYHTGTLKFSIGSATTLSYNPLAIQGSVRAFVDNTSSCGTAVYRWSVVYAATGAINTSDGSQKQQIRDLSATEKLVAQRLKLLIKAFKFNDAVEAKGDAARIHVGVIAQDVQLAFAAEGLSAEKYAMFCSDLLEDGTNRLGVRYDELIAFIIGSL